MNRISVAEALLPLFLILCVCDNDFFSSQFSCDYLIYTVYPLCVIPDLSLYRFHGVVLTHFQRYHIGSMLALSEWQYIRSLSRNGNVFTEWF